MRDWTAEGWGGILSENGLGSFDAIWDACHEWVEEPNHHRRRGGWNAVARKAVRTPDRGEVGIYIKVHEGLCRRTPLHPIRGEPVLARELRSNLRCVELGVRCAPPLYFASRWIGGKSRALYISEELKDCEPLNETVDRWEAEGWPGPAVRRRLAAAVAAEFRKIHDGGLVGVYLVPKHVFVKTGEGPGGIDPDIIGLIDLERMKRAQSLSAARLRDFKRLHEAAPEWSGSDRIRFLRAYDQTARLTPEAKALWRRLEAGADRLLSGAGHQPRAVGRHRLRPGRVRNRHPRPGRRRRDARRPRRRHGGAGRQRRSRFRYVRRKRVRRSPRVSTLHFFDRRGHGLAFPRPPDDPGREAAARRRGPDRGDDQRLQVRRPGTRRRGTVLRDRRNRRVSLGASPPARADSAPGPGRRDPGGAAAQSGLPARRLRLDGRAGSASPRRLRDETSRPAAGPDRPGRHRHLRGHERRRPRARPRRRRPDHPGRARRPAGRRVHQRRRRDPRVLRAGPEELPPRRDQSRHPCHGRRLQHRRDGSGRARGADREGAGRRHLPHGAGGRVGG